MKKRLLVLIFMALVFSGCKKNNEVIADDPMVVVMSQSVTAECTIKEINSNRFYCVINIDNTIYKEGDIVEIFVEGAEIYDRVGNIFVYDNSIENLSEINYSAGDILNVVFSTYEYLESDKNHKIILADTINYISGTAS